MSQRLRRVEELLKRELGESIRRELSIDQAGVVSVTRVGVSSDLRTAAVFVGVIGSAEQKAEAIKQLRKKRKRLQGELARQVVLKYTPKLKFFADDSVEEGDRVLSIIAQIEETLPEDGEKDEDVDA